MEHYKYVIFDAQWFLTRNFKLNCKFYRTEPYLHPDGSDSGLKIKIPKFTELDLAKSFFWSIAKFCNEVASAEKVILLWDKYPYHKLSYLSSYKGDRHYASEDDLKKLDPEKDLKKILETKFDIECLEIKQKAKYWIINHFDQLGMKSYIRTGYEADDFACLLSWYLSNQGTGERSAIVSSDSDWGYLTSPNVDKISPAIGRKPVTIKRYSQFIDKYGDLMKTHNISLYNVKGIIDSAWGSHNALKQTLKETKGIDIQDVVHDVMLGKFNLIKDVDLFKRQFESFNITKYPDYEKTLQSFYYLDKSGKILSSDDYFDFVVNSGFGVSMQYYHNFTKKLNTKLYE